MDANDQPTPSASDIAISAAPIPAVSKPAKKPRFKAMHWDGLLYMLIAGFGTAIVCLSTDEAKNYVDPMTLFWLKTSSEVIASMAATAKAFRSTSFADQRKS